MASNTAIQLKKSGVSGNTPTNLQHGEVAINYADGKLYYKDDLDQIRHISNQDTFGSILANGTLIISTSSADVINVTSNDNIKITGTSGTKTINFDLADEISVTKVYANTVDVHTKLYAGIATSLSTELPNVIAQFASNSASYTQVNQENINPNGSADWVATADVGTDTTFYVDLGIQNSSRTDGTIKPLDSYLLAQGNTGQLGGNLVIGTISGSSVVETRFIVGGYSESNVAFKTANTGLTLPAEKRLNYANSTGIRAYQYFNDATGSIDTIFV